MVGGGAQKEAATNFRLCFRLRPDLFLPSPDDYFRTDRGRAETGAGNVLLWGASLSDWGG